jgi:predicted  nucleic acid-binding Zn-ribbon protein
MPNKCTKCGKLHPDDANYLVNGCNECGSKFFFYIRQEVLDNIEKDIEKLTPKEINEIERDIRDIVQKGREDGETVILDLEAVRVIKPGKYIIDVTNLFTQKPIVIRISSGKYELDLSTLITRQK